MEGVSVPILRAGFGRKWTHVAPEGDTTNTSTDFTTLETQPWVQPIWVQIPASPLTTRVTSTK